MLYALCTLLSPWPWYIAGPLIGLLVPALLILGNRSFGMSATLRHICAACFPGKIDFFHYNWRKEIWNLVFAVGIIVGAFIAVQYLSSSDPVIVHPDLAAELSGYGINDYHALIPTDVMNWHSVLTFKGFMLMIVGGFLVGFGTRYAGGCTSGHSILGISMLQWPSMVATICFMVGGFIMANLFLPLILGH